MGKTIKITLLLLLYASNVYAGWNNQTNVITAQFGDNQGQVGIEYDDMGGSFPRSFGVSKAQKIIVADDINEVLHIFNSDGSLLFDIKNPLQDWSGWPGDVIVNGNCAIVGYVEHTHTYDTETGQLVGKALNMGGADYISTDCSKIYTGFRNDWKAYSPTGELLQTYTEKPLELGSVETKQLGPKEYKTTLTYPDKKWTIIEDGSIENFVRDSGGNLYGIADRKVVRFDATGNAVAEVNMPENQYSRTSVSEGVPHPTGYITEVVAEYGQPVVAPNGDVYTWKRTPDKYSIIKWTWKNHFNKQP